VPHAQFPYPESKCLTLHFPLVRLSSSISAIGLTRHYNAPPLTPLRAPRHLSSLRECVRELLDGTHRWVSVWDWLCGGERVGWGVGGGGLQKRKCVIWDSLSHPLVLQTVPTPLPPLNFTVPAPLPLAISLSSLLPRSNKANKNDNHSVDRRP
jgi:hypothetical protein